MAQSRNAISNALFSLTIVVLAGFVVHRFFLPLAWGAILCIATWPLYQKTLKKYPSHPLICAAVMTISAAFVFFTPVLVAVLQVSRQAPEIAQFLTERSKNGIPEPAWLTAIPFLGSYVQSWWHTTIGQPNGLPHLFSERSSAWIGSATEIFKLVGAQIFHRTLDAAFALVSLYFFYKDGDALTRQIDSLGSYCLGSAQWARYAQKIPVAIRATVNGLVLVGFGEGILIGIGYVIAGAPSPILCATLTGILAIIPFGAPVAYLAVAGLLLANGSVSAAIAIAVWGSVVLFIADHFVRPAIIGNATHLPFLAILFGILGGVETLGLVGLFIGPVLMVMFIAIWQELNLHRQE